MAGEDDQAAASSPLALDEPPELTRTESYLNEPVLPVQTTRASTRDKESTKRHNEERDHSCRSTKVCKTRVPQAQVSRGLLMRSALPEKLVARAEGEDIRDTVFTVPLSPLRISKKMTSRCFVTDISIFTATPCLSPCSPRAAAPPPLVPPTAPLATTRRLPQPASQALPASSHKQPWLLELFSRGQIFLPPRKNETQKQIKNMVNTALQFSTILNRSTRTSGQNQNFYEKFWLSSRTRQEF